jgi:hypothetical protein
VRAFLLALLAAAGVVPAVRAQDAFEIQVYDADTAPAGEIGLETHLNSVLTGRRTTSAEGEAPTHRVFHATLEPHLGVTDFFEVGMYLQSAVRPGFGYDWAGFKLRAKVRAPSPAFGWLKLALNGELSFVPKRFEAAGTGGELRPIAEGAFGPLTLGVNPIVAFTFDNGVHADLEPSARALFRVAPWLSAGAEYYSALGPIDGLLPASEQVHRVFGVVELYSGHFDINFGIGGGTGDDSFLAKAILTVRP